MVTRKSRTVRSLHPTHEALDTLKERLQCEYAGALPKGEIAHVVGNSVRHLYRSGLRGDSLVSATENVARQALIRRISVTIRGEGIGT